VSFGVFILVGVNVKATATTVPEMLKIGFLTNSHLHLMSEPDWRRSRVLEKLIAVDKDIPGL
jgi:hypothetical protein